MASILLNHGHDTRLARRALLVLLTAVAVLLLLAATPLCPRAHAAEGTIYGCTINPVYEHPVTGEIEDTGGTSAKVTGQAMVESCISGEGMLEVTADGEYYLTIRLSLMDHTSGHSFQVQTWGDTDWTNPRLGVTGTGTDKNGATSDVCIQVPSQKCVVRVEMYVEDMGRTIICYCYPTDFEEGAPEGFNPVAVTSAEGTGEQADADASADDASVDADDEQAEDAALDDVSDQVVDADDEADDDEVEDLDSDVVDSAKGLTLSTEDQTGSADGTSSPIAVVAIACCAVLALCLAAVAFSLLRGRRRGTGLRNGRDPEDYDYLYAEGAADGGSPASDAASPCDSQAAHEG